MNLKLKDAVHCFNFYLVLVYFCLFVVVAVCLFVFPYRSLNIYASCLAVRAAQQLFRANTCYKLLIPQNPHHPKCPHRGLLPEDPSTGQMLSPDGWDNG